MGTGLATDHARWIDTFAEYHADQTDNTRAAQLDALKCFSTYLAAPTPVSKALALHLKTETMLPKRPLCRTGRQRLPS